MTNFWYIKDFHGDRKLRIGSSDIAKMIPNPEKPTESLAGYEQTAITVWKEKSGLSERTPAGKPAEKGHYDETKGLEWFIRSFSGYIAGVNFRLLKLQYEGLLELSKIKQTEYPNPETYQHPAYKHNVQFYNDSMIAHPDCVYVPNSSMDYKKTVEGITVDLSNPFLIEAKSAQFFAAKRREGSLVQGYDFELLTWHGIPLKHYVQIQFQLALFEIKTAYLALIYDTSKFQVWRVDANEKWQARIIDLVGRMIKHINDKTMPKELAMNKADIMEIYPKIEKDYVMLSGDALKSVKGLCKESNHAKQQEANWKAKKIDANDALAVMLKDYGELRNGSDILAKWQEKKGSWGIKKPEGIEGKESFIIWLKKNDMNAYKYLERKGFIRKGAGSRNVSVKFKGE